MTDATKLIALLRAASVKGGMCDVAADLIEQQAAKIAEIEARSEPVAWLHTMHMEGGQTDERLSFSDSNPWGTPGLNYSEEYVVTTEPLYAAPVSTGPRYDWSVSGMKQSETGNWVMAEKKPGE